MHVNLKHLQALKYHKELDRFFPLIQARLNENKYTLEMTDKNSI